MAAGGALAVPQIARASLMPLIALLAAVALPAFAAGDESIGQIAYHLTVLGKDGRPAPGALVAVRHAGERRPPQAADESGHLVVEALTPGDAAIFLVASADGSETALEPVFVVPNQDQRLTIPLYPPGRALGVLLDHVGQPVADATAQLSVPEWLGYEEAGRAVRTDEGGRFEFRNLIPGAYYRVAAYAGAEDTPTTTWRSRGFAVRGWDGVRHIEPLFPEGIESCSPRPEGSTVEQVASGRRDEWFDVHLRVWLPAVETFDPNQAWATAPEGAAWIWRAGRPDPVSERLGAVAEFRRRFVVERAGRELTGYLTILADDYAFVRLNGEWIGMATQYRQPATFVIDPTLLRDGDSELQVTLHNAPGVGRDEYNPTGLAYSLELIETQ
jgi:hypothetical protein